MDASSRQQQQQVPIDISFAKLSDWLVDRRRIPSDWRKKLAQIRSKISSLIPALPKEADPWFLTLDSEGVGYLEAKRICDILLKTKPEERTVFGRLSGVAGEWDAIVRAYEKDFVYLGEAAQIMTQNVNYEIPFQKKQIAKVQQQLADLDRKEAELKRNAAASASRYQQACQELGISGMSVRSELLASVSTLPKIFAELGEILCGRRVDEALQVYQVFVSYAHTENKDEVLTTLETLRDVRSTPCDFQAVMPPVQTDSTVEETQTGVEGIQWDLSDSTGLGEQDSKRGEDEAAEIRWDIDFPDSAEEPVELTSQTEKEVDVSEIVWEIDVGTAEEEEEEEEGGNSVHEEQQDAPFESISITSEQPPPSRLLDMSFRNSLLNDLFEIKAFLGQRIEELESSGNATLQSQMQAVAPAAVQQHGAQALKEMAEDIARALNLLTNSRTRDLLRILTSRRFLDKLEASLQQKKQSEIKSLDSLKDLAQKRVELRNSLTSSWPKQEELMARTKQVKASVEKSLSRLYEGRRVNIIGEINAIVAS